MMVGLCCCAAATLSESGFCGNVVLWHTAAVLPVGQSSSSSGREAPIPAVNPATETRRARVA